MISDFNRLSAKLHRRVSLMIRRAVVALVDDDPQRQVVQVEALKGETLDGVERFQQYGFSSVPHPDAQAILLALGGAHNHPIAVVVDDPRHRPTGMKPGEVCLFTDEDTDDAPHRVELLRGNVIRLSAGASSIELAPAGITLTAPRIDMN